jgi:glucose/arabinose dehydrogenase
VVTLPNAHGIALHDGRMYIAAVREVYVADMKDGRVGQPRRIIDSLPPGGRHPNRTLAFGPDGMLYITVGSTCNCCVEASPLSATILRAKPDGTDLKVFCEGLRNTLGFGWHPRTKVMYGMDHGTDWLGDTIPPEEFNQLQEGRHYGWPFAYANNQIIQIKNYPDWFDPKQWAARSTGPVLMYDAHAAPLQMTFYTGAQFPAEYRNDAFVAMHGSWNRKPPVGYEVVRIRFENGQPKEFVPFLTGFLLEGPAFFSRPAGIAVAQDGSLLIGDDANGMMYRVSYTGKQ